MSTDLREVLRSRWLPGGRVLPSVGKENRRKGPDMTIFVIIASLEADTWMGDFSRCISLVHRFRKN